MRSFAIIAVLGAHYVYSGDLKTYANFFGRKSCRDPGTQPDTQKVQLEKSAALDATQRNPHIALCVAGVCNPPSTASQLPYLRV